MSFEKLGLSENILKTVRECGYENPTPIQEQAIPQILMGRDVVGLAQTGTGKTAGFTLPMIEILAGGRAKARMPRSLVLTPTRELAAQVAENFDTYGKYSKLAKALLVGGESMEEQIKILERGADVLIATPGRLLDLFERGKILLNDIKVLVIDEADRMLDMGFIPDIEKIVGLIPPIRQTLLFSATMPPEIRKLTQKFQSNPREVSVAPPASTAERVQQFKVQVHPRDKNKILEQLIKREEVQNAFIFCNRKRDVDSLYKWLQKNGHPVKALHGDMAQAVRTQTLQDFKDDKVTLLVCSDVAARGLDIDGMSHVFNFDVPMNADDYVHRIGRTGRAGKEGRAWMLVTRADGKYIDAIERLIKEKIEEVSLSGEKKSGGQDGKAQHKKRQPDKKQGREKEQGTEDKPRKKSAPASRQKQAGEDNRHQGGKKQGRSQGGDGTKGFGEDIPGFFAKR